MYETRSQRELIERIQQLESDNELGWYCWFETVTDLIEDHRKIKKQISERELQLDELSREMMSINM